ncbi:MAG TPA: hypothetical protein VJS92_15965 [Candidatus Polarisedimenticolaceae bacterium]|nr:hypothetical protein [Candidatus Polarisedimenticolaceae bacterium]
MPQSATPLRPLAVTLAAWLFVVVGGGGIVAGAWRLFASTRSAHEIGDAAWACGSGLVALAGGILLLRGLRWGRWLLAAWMAFHIVLSVLHGPAELIVHAVLFALIGFVLFRPR